MAHRGPFHSDNVLKSPWNYYFRMSFPVLLYLQGIAFETYINQLGL